MTDAFALAASMRLSDGRTWGSVAEPFQLDDLCAVLDPDVPRSHFDTRARGGGKTTDAGVAGLALLATEAPPLSRSYAVAADADQAGLVLDAMRGLVARTPGLDAVFTVEARRVVNRETLATLEVLAADGPSAYGLLPWMVIVDEIAQWPATPNAYQVWEAIISAMPKVPGARLIVLTSAGSPSHWSYKVLVQARSSSRWRTSEQPGPVPHLDPADLAEVQAVLPPSAVRRLIYNEWTESADAVFTLDDVAACTVLPSPLEPRRGQHYVLAVDLGWRHDNTAIAICHRESSGDTWKVVCDRLEVLRPGGKGSEVDVGVVEQRVVDLARVYRARIVFDPRELISSAQRWRKAGLRVAEHVFSVGSNTRLALRLLELVRAHRLVLPDDDDLADELGRIRIVERGPGLFKVDVAPGGDGHGDRTVAIGMAALALGERAPIGRASFGPTRPMGSVRDSPPPPTLDDLRRGLYRAPIR